MTNKKDETTGGLPQLGDEDGEMVVEATEMLTAAQASERLQRLIPLPSMEVAVALPDDVHATLEVVAGPARGVQFPLSMVTTAVGRPIDRRGSSAADFRVDDPTISRKHAIVVYENEHFHVRDVGSGNGVFLNGKRVADDLLRDSDKLVLGGTTLLFRVQRSVG